MTNKFEVSTQDTIRTNRKRYLGGSDFPALFDEGFGNRWDMILHKAGLKESTNFTSVAMEYGNKMEPIIRNYTNRLNGNCYTPISKTFEDKRVRINVDGFDEERNSVLEIKTTSSDKPQCYHYLQLLFYMHYLKADEGVLAVLVHDEWFSEQLSDNRLTYQVFNSTYELATYIDIEFGWAAFDVEEIVKDFWRDVALVEATHEAGQDVTRALIMSEPELAVIDDIEPFMENYKWMVAHERATKNYLSDFKDRVNNLFESEDIKQLVLLDDSKITRVLPKSKVVDVVDYEKVIDEIISTLSVDKDLVSDIIESHTTQKVKETKGYVKITVKE